MSGFCGFTGSVCRDEQNTVLHNMLHTIKHRGPDGTGLHVDADISLGFLQLGSSPLQGGAQPLYNEDRSLLLVFDGTLYGTVDLQQALIDKGHELASRADGEIVLHLYEEYGAKLLDHIRGTFSFLIYDLQNKAIFAARDFFGVKPFYYTLIDGQLVFASELKSILTYPGFRKELNQEALEAYLSFQYVVLPESFFKGVYKLPAAHYLTCKDGKVETTQYWDAIFEPDDTKMLEETVDEIDQLVKDLVAEQEAGDVEVGSCLSSGVDSSYIAATFQGGKTFTVGFSHADYSEIEYARRLSETLGIENHHKIISAEEYWDSLSKIQYQMDEPLADPAAVALFFLCGLAKEHVEIVFSGEGADELFGGYTIYKEPLSLKPLTRLPMPLRRLLGRLAAILPAGVKGRSFFIRGSMPVEERFIGNANIFTEKEKRTLLKAKGSKTAADITKPYYDKVAHLDDVTKMQYIDINLWMAGDILQKADRMSAAHSLEIRSPLLDQKAFRVAASLPTQFRVNQQSTKYAFRLAARRYLPQIVAEKKKLGFPVPTRVWLREEPYYNRVKAAFGSEQAKAFFHTELLLRLLDEHKSGKADHGRKIWTVFTFLVWYEVFFDHTPEEAREPVDTAAQ